MDRFTTPDYTRDRSISSFSYIYFFNADMMTINLNFFVLHARWLVRSPRMGTFELQKIFLQLFIHTNFNAQKSSPFMWILHLSMHPTAWNVFAGSCNAMFAPKTTTNIPRCHFKFLFSPWLVSNWFRAFYFFDHPCVFLPWFAGWLWLGFSLLSDHLLFQHWLLDWFLDPCLGREGGKSCDYLIIWPRLFNCDAHNKCLFQNSYIIPCTLLQICISFYQYQFFYDSTTSAGTQSKNRPGYPSADS